MTTATAAKLTYADYLLFPDDGQRREIIDGELYVSPGPNMAHQLVAMNIIRALDQFVHPRRLGRVFIPRYDLILSIHDIVEPDICFVSNARLHVVTRANLQGAPDLAVEVLSANRRNDEIVKKKLYENFGVNEYWIADPELETVKIYRRSGEAFAPAEIIGTEDGATIATPLLPGFELPIADVFAE